jgi:hypothetical protein
MHGLQLSRRAELVLGACLTLVFLTANLSTSARSPVIWQDEVMFTDPAANLHLGHGFTSSAWFQSRDSLFAGNSPLYSLVLSVWIRTFGFNVVAVRALNYVLILGVVATVLVSLRRLGLVRSSFPRITLVLLMLCGDGVTYSYRSGRYDCLGMLIVGMMFLAVTLHRPGYRVIVLFLLAGLAPWAGLQLLAYLALMGLVMLLLRRHRALSDLLAVGGGCLAGILALGAFLFENGVWHEFLKSVSILSGAGRSLSARIAAGLIAPFTEPSSILLLAVLGVLLVLVWREGTLRLRSPIALGSLVGLVLPCLLALTGKFARYYAWMAFIPMAACVAAELEFSRWRPLRGVILPLVILSCVVGLPARVALTVHEWRLRDPAPVDRTVQDLVRPTDWVYSEFEAYYPAKKAAAVVFLPPYAGLIPEMQGVDPPLSESDREAVDLLILKPSTEQKTLHFFGGRWRIVGRYSAVQGGEVLASSLGMGAKPYDLTVYRRQTWAVAAAR